MTDTWLHVYIKDKIKESYTKVGIEVLRKTAKGVPHPDGINVAWEAMWKIEKPGAHIGQQMGGVRGTYHPLCLVTSLI